MPQGLDTSPSTSTPWASDLPSTIAKVPRVATLIEDLGIGGTSKSVDRFKTVLKSFRQDYVTKSGARVSDLNDWHSDAHQEDLALAAMAFMEQQGQLFWPDEGFTENTKWLGVTADHDEIGCLLHQLIYKQNLMLYQNVRAKRKWAHPDSSERPETHSSNPTQHSQSSVHADSIPSPTSYEGVQTRDRDPCATRGASSLSEGGSHWVPDSEEDADQTPRSTIFQDPSGGENYERRCHDKQPRRHPTESGADTGPFRYKRARVESAHRRDDQSAGASSRQGGLVESHMPCQDCEGPRSHLDGTACSRGDIRSARVAGERIPSTTRPIPSENVARRNPPGYQTGPLQGLEPRLPVNPAVDCVTVQPGTFTTDRFQPVPSSHILTLRFQSVTEDVATQLRQAEARRDVMVVDEPPTPPDGSRTVPVSSPVLSELPQPRLASAARLDRRGRPIPTEPSATPASMSSLHEQLSGSEPTTAHGRASVVKLEPEPEPDDAPESSEPPSEMPADSSGPPPLPQPQPAALGPVWQFWVRLRMPGSRLSHQLLPDGSLDALKGMETLSLSQFRDYIREKTEHEICDSGPRGICVIVRDPFGVNETVKVLRDEGQQPLKRLLSQIRDLQDEALERYHEEHRTDVPLFKFTLEAWTS